MQPNLAQHIFRTIQPAYKKPQQERIAEAKKWIMHVKHDMWFNHEMPITWDNLAAACELGTKSFLQQFMNGLRETPYMADKILELKRKVDSREAVFIKTFGVYYLDYTTPRLCGPILKRTEREEDWHPVSTCRACSNNHYLPALMNDEDHALCYHCIPPSSYAAYGAELQSGSLILYTMDEMGILEDINLVLRQRHEAEHGPIAEQIEEEVHQEPKKKGKRIKRTFRKEWKQKRDELFNKQWGQG